MTFKRNVVLVLVLIVLAACGTLPPPGNYIVQPISGPITPEYVHCEYGQCWNVVFSDTVFEPTQDIFPTDTPVVATPTVAPLYVCPSGDFVNVRAEQSAISILLGTLRAGQRAWVYTSYKDWYQIRFNSRVAYVSKSYTEYCTDGIIVP